MRRARREERGNLRASGRRVLDVVNAAAVRSALGAGRHLRRALGGRLRRLLGSAAARLGAHPVRERTGARVADVEAVLVVLAQRSEERETEHADARRQIRGNAHDLELPQTGWVVLRRLAP